MSIRIADLPEDDRPRERLWRKGVAGLRRERVLVLVLDAGNRVQRVVALTDGSIDRSLLPVREVLNAVLRNDGAASPSLTTIHPATSPRVPRTSAPPRQSRSPLRSSG